MTRGSREKERRRIVNAEGVPGMGGKIKAITSDCLRMRKSHRDGTHPIGLRESL